MQLEAAQSSWSFKRQARILTFYSLAEVVAGLEHGSTLLPYLGAQLLKQLRFPDAILGAVPGAALHDLVNHKSSAVKGSHLTSEENSHLCTS